MDIEQYLQSTEEEMEEVEQLEGVNEELAEGDTALEKSASKRHPHIGVQRCLSMAHAWAHALFLLPKNACPLHMTLLSQ